MFFPLVMGLRGAAVVVGSEQSRLAAGEGPHRSAGLVAEVHIPCLVDDTLCLLDDESDDARHGIDPIVHDGWFVDDTDAADEGLDGLDEAFGLIFEEELERVSEVSKGVVEGKGSLTFRSSTSLSRVVAV